MEHKITLIDGRELECHPKAQHPESIESNDIALDTTGKYLQIGNKPKSVVHDNKHEEEIAKAEQLFYRNAHLFLANADKIFSDSRLFLAPVCVENGLAYIGTSGMNNPVLGVYVEWWLYNNDVSFDTEGYPIWFISGSPLSGCHACSSVDHNGMTHRAQLNERLVDVWRAFAKINTRYDEAKARYIAYDLQEVVNILEDTTDSQQYFVHYLRVEQIKYDNIIRKLDNKLKQADELLCEYKTRIQHLLVNQHREQVEAYYNKCRNLQNAASLSHENFLKRRIELRKELRSGAITNPVYQKQLTPLRRQAEDDDFQYRSYEHDGLDDVFGEDAGLFTFDVIKTLMAESAKSEYLNNRE